MSVAGQYDCVTKSPMGDQKSVLTVNVDGDSWTGSNAGQMGSLDITDGKVDGNTLTWTMDMKILPVPGAGRIFYGRCASTGSFGSGASLDETWLSAITQRPPTFRISRVLMPYCGLCARSR